jgi:DNA-binding CsgD family transcriptional regulator
MNNLEQYIEQINSSQTPEQAFDRFCSIMRAHGYDRIAYSLVTDHPSLGLPKQHGLATSYPEDWMKYYREKSYMAIDPVTKRVLDSRKPFFWSDVTDNPDLFAPSKQLMNEAEDAGVSDGIGISLCGQSGELVGVGLARNAPSKGNDYQFLAGAYLLSVYFHETYRDMLTEPHDVEISSRESEILCWAAEGKTDEDISMLLNISKNTVRFHWKRIFAKLEANGRQYAITKAIRMRLITPTFVSSPYHKR